MVDEKAEEVIRNMDDEKVLEMLETERKKQTSPDFERAQKKLLDEIGLFDIDLDRFDLSDELERQVLYLKYFDSESDTQHEFSEEVKQRTKERMRELGFEPSDDN